MNDVCHFQAEVCNFQCWLLLSSVVAKIIKTQVDVDMP